MSEPASPSSPVSPTAPSMVSLARALNSTPVAATPRPASRAATVERPKVASPSRAVQRMGSKPPWHLVELLLVDGTRKRYDVGGEVSVGGVKRDVWEGWPEGERGTASNAPTSICPGLISSRIEYGAEFSSAGHGRPAGADGLRM